MDATKQKGSKELFLRQFVDKVLVDNQDSFMMEDGSYKYLFTQAKIGTAKYVYGNYELYKERFSFTESKMTLIAIVVSEEVILVDSCIFRIYESRRADYLPQNVTLFPDFINQLNKRAADEIFADFYNGLEVSKDIDEDDLRKCRGLARESILSHKEYKKPCIETMVNAEDAAKILCGFLDLKSFVLEHLNEYKKEWIWRKTIYEKVTELINALDNTEEYERYMADVLTRNNTKTVTVEFEFHGEVGVEKIDSDTILHRLISNDYFSDFNFCSTKRGGSLIASLGAARWRCPGGEVLTCKHIKSIKSRGKTIYERPDTVK